ncbi:MAG: metallophosphoesterase [Oceanococcus sp.]
MMRLEYAFMLAAGMAIMWVGKKNLWIPFVLGVALLGCNADQGHNAGNGSGAAGGKVRFIALGDVGTGYCTEVEDTDICPQPQSIDEEHGQVAVAQVVEQVCALRGCDFATMAGDNIYEQGVDAVDSFRFQDTFEIPYQNLNFPFFAALGNHDNSLANSLAEQGGFYGEGRSNARGDFQVEYSARSSKWVMPARFYSETWPRGSANPLVELFVIDSSPLSHYLRDETGWYSEGFEDYLLDQTAWLQEKVSSSKARWKLALAHHPYISNGDHGNAGSYDEIELPPPSSGPALDGCTAFPVGYGVVEPGTFPLADPSCRGAQYKQMLEETICGEVDLMLQGHDHDLQWLLPNESCSKTQFILSGAGGKFRELRNESRNAVRMQQGGTFGFFWVEMDASGSMTVATYAVEHGENGGVSSSEDEQGNPIPVFEETVAQTP